MSHVPLLPPPRRDPTSCARPCDLTTHRQPRDPSTRRRPYAPPSNPRPGAPLLAALRHAPTDPPPATHPLRPHTNSQPAPCILDTTGRSSHRAATVGCSTTAAPHWILKLAVCPRGRGSWLPAGSPGAPPSPGSPLTGAGRVSTCSRPIAPPPPQPSCAAAG
jgi:hypothetical protein